MYILFTFYFFLSIRLLQTLRAMVKRKMATSSCCVLSPPACNKSIVDIKFHIDKILYFLDSFGWLADVYVSVTISFSLHFLYFNFKVLETPCKDYDHEPF